MKIILLIYYNHNHNNFYCRYLNSGIDLYVKDYHVGYKNSYEHEIISIILFDDDKCISISNHSEYLDYYKRKEKKGNRNIKNDLIDKTICLLNKFKK